MGAPPTPVNDVRSRAASDRRPRRPLAAREVPLGGRRSGRLPIPRRRAAREGGGRVLGASGTRRRARSGTANRMRCSTRVREARSAPSRESYASTTGPPREARWQNHGSVILHGARRGQTGRGSPSGRERLGAGARLPPQRAAKARTSRRYDTGGVRRCLYPCFSRYTRRECPRQYLLRTAAGGDGRSCHPRRIRPPRPARPRPPWRFGRRGSTSECYPSPRSWGVREAAS